AKLQKKTLNKQKQRRKTSKTPLSGSSGDDMDQDGSDIEDLKARGTATKSDWAFSHFTPIPMNNKGAPIW
ncbi:hypothetical protein FRC01_013661, partial [Tulasnella sp. 417]